MKEVLKRNAGNEWSVYIVECSDGSLYTGYTNNVFQRVTRHNTGNGAKYTRSRQPVKLVHYETYPTKSDAMKREAAVKALSREEKIKYINGFKSSAASKWPTLERRLNQPLTSRGEALEQMKANGDILTPWAEKELQRWLKKKRKTKV